MSGQLDLFDTGDTPGVEPDAPACGWLPERRHPDLRSCVRAPDHEGRHVVWRQGPRDIVVWQAASDGRAGTEIHRRRLASGTRPLHADEVFKT